MAGSTPFDGTVFNPDVPDSGEPHGNDYQEHQATKKAMEFVNNKEHEDIGADPSASDGGGVHSLGSSVAYWGTATPTKRPDGSTNLANNAIDKGRVWFDSNFSPPVMMKWDGSAWVQTGNKVLNDTYYTGVNEADNGTVELIKAGKNEADDADVAIVSDGIRTATDAAPDEDTGLTNKKYVDTRVDTHSGIIKAWGTVASNGTIVGSGYNVTPSRTDTGDYTLTWGTDFANTSYAVVATIVTNGNGINVSVHTFATGTCQILCTDASNSPSDQQFSFIAIGTQ